MEIEYDRGGTGDQRDRRGAASDHQMKFDLVRGVAWPKLAKQWNSRAERGEERSGLSSSPVPFFLPSFHTVSTLRLPFQFCCYVNHIGWPRLDMRAPCFGAPFSKILSTRSTDRYLPIFTYNLTYLPPNNKHYNPRPEGNITRREQRCFRKPNRIFMKRVRCQRLNPETERNSFRSSRSFG